MKYVLVRIDDHSRDIVHMVTNNHCFGSDSRLKLEKAGTKYIVSSLKTTRQLLYNQRNLVNSICHYTIQPLI